MIISKRLLSHLFIGCEVLLFFAVYMWGEKGLKKIWSEQLKNKKLEQLIVDREQEIIQLKQSIQEWQQPFRKETLARVELQMARPEEEVYVIVDDEQIV